MRYRRPVPNARRVATGEGSSQKVPGKQARAPDGEGGLMRWSADGQHSRTFGGWRRFTALAVAPDGTVAALSEDREAILFEAE